MKEEYVFRKSGKFVRISWVSGALGTPVWDEVTQKMGSWIDYAETLW